MVRTATAARSYAAAAQHHPSTASLWCRRRERHCRVHPNRRPRPALQHLLRLALAPRAAATLTSPDQPRRTENRAATAWSSSRA